MNITLHSIVYQLDGEIVLYKLWIPIGKKIIFCLHGIIINILTVIWKTYKTCISFLIEKKAKQASSEQSWNLYFQTNVDWSSVWI